MQSFRESWWIKMCEPVGNWTVQRSRFIHSNESESDSLRRCLLIFVLSCVWGGVKEGGSQIHQSAASPVAFKEPFVSITRFFSISVPLHRHIGRRKASPCYFSSPFLLRRTVDTSARRERCFCFDAPRASVSFCPCGAPGASLSFAFFVLGSRCEQLLRSVCLATVTPETCPKCACLAAARRWSAWVRGCPISPSRRRVGTCSARWITMSWRRISSVTWRRWRTRRWTRGTLTSPRTRREPADGSVGKRWTSAWCPDSTAGRRGERAPVLILTRLGIIITTLMWI